MEKTHLSSFLMAGNIQYGKAAIIRGKLIVIEINEFISMECMRGVCFMEQDLTIRLRLMI